MLSKQIQYQRCYSVHWTINMPVCSFVGDLGCLTVYNKGAGFGKNFADRDTGC